MWPSPPYYASDRRRKPRFVLLQRDDTTFEMVEGFVYRPPGGRPEVIVDEVTLPATDLASIPWFASWFVSRHGRHTPAALVHDCQVHKARTEDDVEARAAADDAFLAALDELHVPPVRGRMMWAAVTMGTRMKRGWPAKIALLLWLVIALVGTGAFVRGAISGQWDLVLVAMVAPVPAALLWGRDHVAGLVASYALLVVGPPAVACVVGYAMYWSVEQIVRFLRMPLKHNRGVELPQPTPIDEVFGLSEKKKDRLVARDRAARAPRAASTP